MSDNVIIKFENYTVEKITYFKNEEYDDRKESIGFPKIFINIVKSNKKNNKFNIILGAKYDIESNFPYILEVIIRGFFETSEELESDEEKLRVIISNGSAIMYPYLRALFSEMTSKSDFSPVILPTINFSSYVKKLHNDLNDFLIDSKYYKENE